MAKAKKEKIERKVYNIDRNFTIWDLSTNASLKPSEIIEKMDNVKVNRQIIWHVMHVLSRYKTKKGINEYFDMGFALKDICIKKGYDPDKYVTSILNALYVREIFTKAKFKKMKADELEALLKGKQIRAAGYIAADILVEYYKTLKK